VNLELSAEQVALRDTVRRVLADEPPARVWKCLGDVGAIDLLVPEADGGSGLGMVEAVIVAEEVGRVLYAGPWLATAVASVRAAAAAGGAFVPGGRAAAVALPWPGHGPGFEIDDAGRVRGGQAHVLGAPAAEVLLVPARSADGVGLVAVEEHAVEPERGIDETTALGTVTADGVAGSVIGVLPEGALDAVRDDLLVAWAADALGCARAVLDLAVEHAKVRHQFGQPIGSFQAVQHLCVDALETVELAAAGVLHAAWAADAGAPDERRLAALRCKAFADRLATVGDIAIQVLGGIGYTWEHGAHLHLRRLLGWSVAFGPASSSRAEIGQRLAGAPT
jgi:acyl-CoA dehydrogenase